jgi:hypothetical protein
MQIYPNPIQNPTKDCSGYDRFEMSISSRFLAFNRIARNEAWRFEPNRDVDERRSKRPELSFSFFKASKCSLGFFTKIGLITCVKFGRAHTLGYAELVRHVWHMFPLNPKGNHLPSSRCDGLGGPDHESIYVAKSKSNDLLIHPQDRNRV